MIKKNLILIVTIFIFVFCLFGCDSNDDDKENGLELICEKYADYFPIGVAIKNDILEMYEDDIYPHFNSVVFEYETKWAHTEQSENSFNFTLPDSLFDYAESKNKLIRGHTLVWYKALPNWVLGDNPTKEKVLDRIDNHVRGVLTHYENRAYCWDVVNEALRDYPSDAQVENGDYFRTENECINGDQCGDLYSYAGIDYIKQAFKSAIAIRDELNLDIKLYYNDYGLNYPNKRRAMLKLLDEFEKDGIHIDGIGMQAHYYLENFNLKDWKDSVDAFLERGYDVQLTELDLSVYPYGVADFNYGDELPEEVELKQAVLYGKIFEYCRQNAHNVNKGSITGITVWGAADDTTNLNNDPIKGRKNFPLIFDDYHDPKEAYWKIINFE